MPIKWTNMDKWRMSIYLTKIYEQNWGWMACNMIGLIDLTNIGKQGNYISNKRKLKQF